MKKKIISLMLVLCMLAACFVGCGKKNNEETNAGETKKLTIGLPQSANVTSYEDNGFTKYLEENLNIKFEFVYFSSTAADYQKQITLMCTSGEKLPDILWGFTGIDRYTVAEFGEDGYFMDLTDPIEKYADNYKAAVARLPKAEQEMLKSRGTSVVDGGFYGMPHYSSDIGIDNIQTAIYVNQTWLDKVGMSKPKNIDDLYKVLKAFKEKDPNGNGEADEIPILSQGIENYILNAFIYTGSYNLNVTDGKVWNPYTTNEYRQALQFCNKLCKEKLLDDLNFTLSSRAEFTSLVTPANDVARVGMFCGHPELVTSTTSGILDQYVALEPLADATGKGGNIVVLPKALAYCAYITADCDDVETAMKFLDFFYLDETTTRMRYGIKDEDWAYDDTAINSYGEPAKFKCIDATAGFQGNATWGVLGPMISTHDNMATSSDDGVNARNKHCSRLLGEAYHIMMDWKKPEEVLENLVYNQKENEQRSSLSTLYNQYIAEARALFITGEMNPDNDSDWNTYLKEVADLGDTKLIEVAQSAYDRENK